MKAKGQILQMIPVGTPAKVAEQKMQSKGFACAYYSDLTGNFLDLSKPPKAGSVRYYLYCRKEHVFVPFVDVPVWVVCFYYDENDKNRIITDVSLYIGDDSVP